MNKIKFTLLAVAVATMAFTLSCSESSENNNTSTCNGKEYNATVYYCEKGEIVGSCRGNSYYPEYEYCDNGVIKGGSGNSSSSLSSAWYSSSSVGDDPLPSSSSDAGIGISSSSSDTPSSSSSSEEIDYPSSSSNDEPSSSSAEPSSSSALSSSSSAVPSSSSSMPSSSSSSSVGKSSSSVGVICSANFKTTKIGTQTWMAENLNCDVEGSKCLYNDPANCTKFGRLYNWVTAMNLMSTCDAVDCSSLIQSPHRGICPSGWHIPSKEDWDVMSAYLGSGGGAKLKARSGWVRLDAVGREFGYNGTDNYGFSALPGGYGNSDGSFDYDDYADGDGYWWTTTSYPRTAYGNVYYLYIRYGDSILYQSFRDNKSFLSVRCLQDTPLSD